MYRRQCVKCGQAKAVGHFYLYRGTHGPRFNRECKACTYQRTRASRIAQGEVEYWRRKRNNPDTHRQTTARQKWRYQIKRTGVGMEFSEYLQRPGRSAPPRCLIAEMVIKRQRNRDAWRPVKWMCQKSPRTGSKGGKWAALPSESPAERYRRLYASDPEFAINERLRRQAKKHKVWGDIQSRIRSATKSERPSGGKLFGFLGYTPDELRSHIERQFSGRMNWQRFMAGEIHIDHVRPVASFDLDQEEQIRECWSLPNLRPCWARANMVKAGRAEFLL